MSEIIQHKCPSCGGPLEFDAKSQKAKCPYCDSEFDATTFENVTAEEKNVESVEMDNWSEDELEQLSQYNCESCGGNIYSDADTAATTCPYCNSPVILAGRLSGALKPNVVIPFKKTKEDAINGLNEHIKGKFLLKRSFKESNAIDEIKGIYVPFWLYDADVDAAVHYEGVIIHRWSTGDADYIQKEHYAVYRAGNMKFNHVPVDGSSKINKTLMESVEPYDYGTTVDFNAGYLSGYLADKYDVDKDAAYPRAKERITNGAVEELKSTISGYDELYPVDKNIDVEPTDVKYALYPLWLLSTSCEGKSFQFAMNGQTGKMVGNLPIDALKSAITIIASILVFGGITGGICFAVFKDAGISFAIGAVVGVIAAVIIFLILRAQLKTVESIDSAGAYLNGESVNVTHSRDIFLYEHTDVIRHNTK